MPVSRFGGGARVIEFNSQAGSRRGQSPSRLTPKERQIVELAHLRNQDIAGLLGVSLATVKTMFSRAMEKTGADNRTHLVVLCMQQVNPPTACEPGAGNEPPAPVFFREERRAA